LAHNIKKKLGVNGYNFAHLTLILLLHYLVKICRSCSLAVCNNEFILGSACVGSETINWIAINTIGNYCLSKSHTYYITSSSLQHVLKMSSSTNASSGRWRHSPTARSVTTLPRAAHSLLMYHFSSSMYGLKMNTTNVK